MSLTDRLTLAISVATWLSTWVRSQHSGVGSRAGHRHKRAFCCGNRAARPARLLLARRRRTCWAARPAASSPCAPSKTESSQTSTSPRQCFATSSTRRRAKRMPGIPSPRVVVCVPSGVTSVEKRAVFEATITAGARQAFLIEEEPMAAAIGAGLPVDSPTGSMVVDIGGGTTEVAVISMGGIVKATSIRIAGDSFDSAIVQYAKTTTSHGHRRSVPPRKSNHHRLCGSARRGSRRRGPRSRPALRPAPTVRIESEDDAREGRSGTAVRKDDPGSQGHHGRDASMASDLMNTASALTGGGGMLRGLDTTPARRDRRAGPSPTPHSSTSSGVCRRARRLIFSRSHT